MPHMAKLSSYTFLIMFGKNCLDYTFDGKKTLLINLIHSIAMLNCIMELLSGPTPIFPVENGYCTLSESHFLLD